MATKKIYQPILNVLFKHEYYFDFKLNTLLPGLCSDFNFSISETNQNKLKNLGIYFRASSSGFELIGSTENVALVSKYSDPIYIEMTFSNSQFLNYSHFDGVVFSEIFEKGKTLFFSNRLVKRFTKSEDNFTDKHEIAQKETAFLKLDDAFKKKNIKKVIFEHQKKSVEKLELIFDKPLNGEAIPLKTLPEGVYKKLHFFDESNNKIGEQNFAFPGVFFTKNPKLIGVIEVYLSQLEKVDYEIIFNKKTAFWDYIIISKKNANPVLEYKVPENKKIKLVYGDAEIKFKKLNLNTLKLSYKQYLKKVKSAFVKSENKLTVFRSEKKLPLSEILNTGISLKKKNFLNEVKEEEALMNPVPGNILKIEENLPNHHVYSLIDISN